MPDGADGRIVKVATSAAFLAPDNPTKRLPRAPRRKRPKAFWDAFEDRAVVYDAFAYGSGRALLVGPPPLNLLAQFETAQYKAAPSGAPLSAAFFPSRSTMITELRGVPEGTTAIEITLAGERFTLPLQPDLSDRFAGRKILYTINRDNRLDWIRHWAEWHAVLHGTDAVILFDNGSRTYAPQDIETVLSTVGGLRTIAVVSLPHAFGPIDKNVLFYTFWPRFLQISASSIALRRFGMKAAGLINCDIDELMWAGEASVYDFAKASPLGVSRVRGRWIEAVRDDTAAASGTHLDYMYRIKDVRAALSPPKCVLDPARGWMDSLRVHPYLHRIHRAPRGARTYQRGAVFFHFKGINTNWKEARTATAGLGASTIRKDDLLSDAVSAFNKSRLKTA